MDKPKPIRLKYIPTDMYAVRYFKEKPFIVPEGMNFGYSRNIDFSKINLDFSQLKAVTNITYGGEAVFAYTTNCSFDLDKLNNYDYFVHRNYPFYNSTDINFEGQFLRSNLQRFFELQFSKNIEKQQLDKISSLIANLKLTYFPTDTEKTGRIYSTDLFNHFNYGGAKIVKKLDNSIKSASFFPKVDMSKWDFEKFYLKGGNWFNYTYIFSLTLPDSENFYRGDDRIFNWNAEIAKIYNFNFKLFYNEFQMDSSSYCPRSKVFFGKNLGWKSDKTIYYLNLPFTETGEILQNYNGEYIDEVTGEESLRSMRYTLIEQSFDRRSAGYSTCTLYLRKEVENLLTSEEKAQITAKGFSLIFNLTGSYT